MKNIKLIFPFLAILLFCFSCSKDDDDPQIRDFETIGFNSEVVINKLPDGLKNSNDEYAQMAVEYVESALDWSSFADQLKPPENAVKTGKKSGETYTWTWNYGGAYVFTMWWSYHDDSDKNYWDIDIQYGDGGRYTYLQAWETKDGKSGQISYNFQWLCTMEETSEDCSDLFWKYLWNVDDDENYSFNYIIESEEAGETNSLNYQTLVNNDGSGSVSYFFYGELLYDISWDTAGNGSWAYYFGDSEVSGNWTAG